MKKQEEMYSIIGVNLKQNTAYEVREESLEGKKHLVVPVVMMVEGVHNGSQGALFHPIDELGKFPASWDGIPIVIDHPQANGIHISANSPMVLEATGVGRVFNTYVEGGVKLKSEAWLEYSKLETISPDTLSAVNSKTPIEVSVGVYTENEETAGVYAGENYSAIARNHRPDHLALLPGGIGACSLIDGCGLGANQKKKGEKNVDIKLAIQTLREQGYPQPVVIVHSETGLNEKLDALRELVRSLRPDVQVEGSWEYSYLVEAYDGYLIYEYETNAGCKYYKRSFQFNVATNGYEFTSEPVEVKKKVEYETVNVNKKMERFDLNVNKNKEGTQMDGKCTPCVEKKVTALIANKDAGFVEADREMLEALSEAQLDKLVPKVIEVNKEVEVVKEVNVLSAEDKNALAYGRKQLKDRRDNMIKGIQDNTAKDLWPETALVAMDDDTLERVFKSVAKETAQTVDYSLNGAAQFATNRSQATEEPLYPTGVVVK